MSIPDYAGLSGLRSKLGHVRRRIKEERNKDRLVPKDYIINQLETYQYELEHAIVERVGVKENQ